MPMELNWWVLFIDKIWVWRTGVIITPYIPISVLICPHNTLHCGHECSSLWNFTPTFLPPQPPFCSSVIWQQHGLDEERRWLVMAMRMIGMPCPETHKMANSIMALPTYASTIRQNYIWSWQSTSCLPITSCRRWTA